MFNLREVVFLFSETHITLPELITASVTRFLLVYLIVSLVVSLVVCLVVCLIVRYAASDVTRPRNCFFTVALFL